MCLRLELKNLWVRDWHCLLEKSDNSIANYTVEKRTFRFFPNLPTLGPENIQTRIYCVGKKRRGCRFTYCPAQLLGIPRSLDFHVHLVETGPYSPSTHRFSRPIPRGRGIIIAGRTNLTRPIPRARGIIIVGGPFIYKADPPCEGDYHRWRTTGFPHIF